MTPTPRTDAAFQKFCKEGGVTGNVVPESMKLETELHQAHTKLTLIRELVNQQSSREFVWTHELKEILNS